MDHADPVTNGVTRRLEVAGLAVDADFAGILPVHAVEDLHQRALAGAVFTEQGVNLARRHVERNPVVREDIRREAFDDSGKLDEGFHAGLIRHCTNLLVSTLPVPTSFQIAMNFAQVAAGITLSL